MRKLITTALFTVISITANASTVTETTKPDGSHTIITQVLDIAFGSNKNAIAVSLIFLGAVICATALWLASQGKGSTPGTASQLSANIPQKLSAKALLSFPALVLIIGAVLSVSGALLMVTERFYSATL